VLVEIPAGAAITIGVQTVVSADPAVATDVVNVAVASVASSANSTATETTASAMVRVTPQAPTQRDRGRSSSNPDCRRR